MTYNVFSGTLNPTHLLTYLLSLTVHTEPPHSPRRRTATDSLADMFTWVHISQLTGNVAILYFEVRKSMRTAKIWVMRCWSDVQMIYTRSSWCHCQLIISCFIKIQIGLAFQVPAYPGCPGKRLLNRCLSVFPRTNSLELAGRKLLQQSVLLIISATIPSKDHMSHKSVSFPLHRRIRQ